MATANNTLSSLATAIEQGYNTHHTKDKLHYSTCHRHVNDELEVNINDEDFSANDTNIAFDPTATAKDDAAIGLNFAKPHTTTPKPPTTVTAETKHSTKKQDIHSKPLPTILTHNPAKSHVGETKLDTLPTALGPKSEHKHTFPHPTGLESHKGKHNTTTITSYTEN
eukprot:5397363-Ditylum_brightwellii.AAC.1